MGFPERRKIGFFRSFLFLSFSFFGCSSDSTTPTGERTTSGNTGGSAQGGGSAGTDSGASGGPLGETCNGQTSSECACPGYTGIRFCFIDTFLPCSCTGGPDSPPNCSQGPNCGGCKDCLETCICNTSNTLECAMGCHACKDGKYANPLSCTICPFRVPPTQICFNDAESACKCACSEKQGTCQVDTGCPAAVRCVNDLEHFRRCQLHRRLAGSYGPPCVPLASPRSAQAPARAGASHDPPGEARISKGDESAYPALRG